MKLSLLTSGCGKLLPRQREGILELLIGVAKEDYEKVARSFFDMGEKVPGVRYDLPHRVGRRLDHGKAYPWEDASRG